MSHSTVWRIGGWLNLVQTTFVGLLPIMTETDIQALFLVPMSVALGFGGLFSTLITLLLVPGIYHMLEDVRELLGMGPGVKPLSIEQETYEMHENQSLGVG